MYPPTKLLHKLAGLFCAEWDFGFQEANFALKTRQKFCLESIRCQGIQVQDW